MKELAFPVSSGFVEPLPFGRYLLVDKIATGGMAEIYLAKLRGIEGFEKTLAIKRILSHWSANKEFISMLIDEAKIVVQLNHANIVQVMELGREQETYYICMEYVDGIDLRRLATTVLQKKGRLPEALAVFVVQELLKGLVYAHNKTDEAGRNLGLVHRDISPQNILVSFSGDVKITDFGIAKAAVRSTETQTGALKGKFAYMSPEQALGEAVDPRTDVFAAGIILFELLTGRRLFGGGRSDIDTLDQVRSADVRFKREEEEQLAAPLRQIVLHALQKDLDRRTPSARDFLSALNDFANKTWGARDGDDLKEFLESVLGPEIAERKKFLMRMSDQTQALPVPAATGSETTDPLVTETLGAGAPGSWGSDLSFLSAARSEEIIVSRLVSIPGIRQQMSKILRGRGLATGVGVVLLLGAAAWYFERPGDAIKTLVVPAAPVTAEQRPENPPPPEVLPPSESTGQEPGKAVTPVAAIDPNTPGSLEVQATPWGFVSVDDGNRLETPLRSLPLRPGSHAVVVRYPPYGQTVRKEVTIRPKDHTICAARFTKGGALLKCD